MKKLILFSSILAIIICISSCKKDSDNESKNYASFTANGKDYFFDECHANEFSMTEGDEVLHFTRIFGYLKANLDSANIISPPSFGITFEGNSTGTYTKDDFIGYIYTILFSTETSQYIFPRIPDDDVKGDFEINITGYSLSDHVISGTFRGILFNYAETDSLLIENGKFHGALYSPPQD